MANEPQKDVPSPALANSLMQLVTGFHVSRIIYVAAELAIADLLANGPMSSGELAAATATHQPTLRRIMRALAAHGIFQEAELDRFSLTPIGSLLMRDAPGSVRAAVLFISGEKGWRVWGDVLHSVRTGESAFEHVYGMPVFDWYRLNPEQSEIHDQAMAALSAPTAAAIVNAYMTFQLTVA